MRFVGYTTVDQPLIAKVLQDKDLAIQDLKNHLNTRLGERLMDPDFGSIIPLLIFATSAVDSAALQLPYRAQLAIIGAMLMLAMASAPFAIAYALKVSQN